MNTETRTLDPDTFIRQTIAGHEVAIRIDGTASLDGTSLTTVESAQLGDLLRGAGWKAEMECTTRRLTEYFGEPISWAHRWGDFDPMFVTVSGGRGHIVDGAGLLHGTSEIYVRGLCGRLFTEEIARPGLNATLCLSCAREEARR